MILPNSVVGELTPSEIAPSTFMVETGLSSGSAFLIEPDVVVTAAHVVEGHTFVGLVPAISDTSAEFGEVLPSFVVFVDKELDLAVLRLLNPSDRVPLEFSENLPAIGSEVAAFGAPSGIYRVTEGEVLAADANSLITSTQVAPGNSGGPLVGADGTVEGVIVQYDPTSQDAFSVPATTVAEFIESVPEAAWSRVPTTSDEPLIVAWFAAGFLIALIISTIATFIIIRYRKKLARKRNLITITLEKE